MSWSARERSLAPSGMLMRLQSARAGRDANDARAPARADRIWNRLAMCNGAPGNRPRYAGSRPAHRKGWQLLPQPAFFLLRQWDAAQAQRSWKRGGRGRNVRLRQVGNDAEAGRGDARVERRDVGVEAREAGVDVVADP